MAGPDHPVDLALGAPNRRERRLASPMACELKWLPDTLLNYATTSVVTGFHNLKWNLPNLPDHLRFMVYEKLYNKGQLCRVGYEWCDLDTFASVLKVNYKRYEIHQIFQALLDHGLRLGEVLVTSYCQKCSSLKETYSRNQRCSLREVETTVDLGFALGRFLSESGWYLGSERCVTACFEMIKLIRHPSGEIWTDIRTFECYFWLLDAFNGYCNYSESLKMYELSKPMAEQLLPFYGSDPDGLQLNLPELYSQYSHLFFCTGRYDKSLQWAMEALKCVKKITPVKTVIEVFRQASKVLVVRRQFKQAELLIRHCVSLTKWNYEGAKKLPGPLVDFGFYLMNLDQTDSATKVYQMALDYRQAQFGGNNLKVAQANEDLAYALYVQEYNSGNFRRAREHAEKAIEISKILLPDNHLLLASCRRVKALILEEIAIDSQDKRVEQLLLGEAEELHLSALTLCKRVFGDKNVQTAKHYGNLGRLYQSMGKLNEAEQMHKKAIAIKEDLLGKDDYEVALSLGHLASLYNYDMGRYNESEALYTRSIEIGKMLFGNAYSGLEYDYRGLADVYVALNNPEKSMEFVAALHQWKALRENEQLRRNVDNLWNSLPMPPNDSLQMVESFLKKYN